MLTIENLVKTFDGERLRRRERASDGGASSGRVHAVDDVSLHVEEGEMFTLLGPSGCGKTTTLRMVAGLERPDSGTITVGQRVLFSGVGGRTLQVPPNQRGLGMVFQSYAIWPHMKVFDNAAFPLQVLPRAKRPGRAEIRDRTMAVLETMQLAHLAGRQATKLSGGQQQRLALARALVTQPSLLLLDEPLSNLDAKLRESLRFELKRLQREIGVTSIYVTHDQIEALALSSRIAVMRDGKVMQVGAPRDIYTRPANRFVAEFIGSSNFVEGTVTERTPTQVVVDTAQGKLRAETTVPADVSDRVVLAIRPEAVQLSAEPATGERPNELRGEAVTRSFLGDAMDHLVRVGATELRTRSHPSVSFAAGTALTLCIPTESITVIPVSEPTH